MEDRLSKILNTFEQALVDNHNGERTDYELKNDYIDLKYGFLQLLLQATHEEPTNFNLDLFQKKVKMDSPIWNSNLRSNKDKPVLHTFIKADQ